MKQRIVVTSATIHEIVEQEIGKYWLDADLNHIDVSNVTEMNNLFQNSDFDGDISNWDVNRLCDTMGMFDDTDFTVHISRWENNQRHKHVPAF